MSPSKENIEEEINSTSERTRQRVRQFAQILFEKEAQDRVTVLKESLLDDQGSAATTAILQKEQDRIFVNNCSESVGTIFKNKAVTLRPDYHSLDSDGNAIVILGLNSILDLWYPTAQAKLFKRNQ
ncbi:hypothetical protein BDF21DRAFT_402162 [Thamnidium elegans]|nr:hypothetical protein BDF21DRAFT_402162 [Thamnidium elegans]